MQKVIDNKAEQQFTLDVDGQTAVAAYQRDDEGGGEVIVFTHTMVPPAIEGRGVGSKLIRAALDSARDQGLKVVPQCPFVAAFIRRHAEYEDLLA